MPTPLLVRRAAFGLLTAVAMAVPIRAEEPRPDVASAVAVLKKYDCHEIDTGTVTAATKSLTFGCHADLPDTAFPKLAAFPNLEELAFISDEVTDAGLAHLKKLPKLRKLHINSSTITDKSMALLKDLPKLEGLTLWRTKVTAKGLAEVQKIKSLKTLVLLGIPATPEVIEQLKRFKHLDELYIGQTDFTDEQRRELTAALPNLSIDKN